MSNLVPRVNLPGIGTATIGYDQMLIGTNTKFDDLATALPLPELSAAFHQFQFYQHMENPYYWSEINLTCSPDHDGFSVLQLYEPALGSKYAATEVEIAVDVDCASSEQVGSELMRVVGLVFKGHHRRHSMRVVFEKNQEDIPPGCLPLPTFYFEDRKSSVRLKVYARQAKRVAGRFAGYIVRIEWTLAGGTIIRKLGIASRRLSDLIKADLLAFVQRDLMIAEVDHTRLGALLLPADTLTRLESEHPDRRYMKGMTAKDYWSRRASFLYLLTRATRDEHLLGGEEWATRVCHESPAQIAGYFRELQASEEASLPERPAHGPSPKVRFSDYALGRIIKKRRILPVPL
ncbi:hypothetical protein RFN25_18075 [Mesorhizobium abyssinicae]|uniref:hypothetical protein n=1 Tax=Mesorhizobium abyssinicae TaxID=1209958 RepID=UPI002A24C675|nr:hypothetical protein [Mesorhizobium abyssinicae]MDX8435333.1 hypothetical protein [Mesorhizobium abyssinicae]